MLVELHRKGGNLCAEAKAGRIRCPLIVRPTSEDVVTGQLVQTLRLINPRHWVSDLLNLGLGTDRFPRQIYRGFRIEPWVNKPRYPRNLLPWDEGSTQVDVQLTWENPRTTVYIEAKYGSDLTRSGSGDDGSSGYPSDQLIRNVRVGLLECGYLRESRLFEESPRDFAVLLFSPAPNHPLVQRYRDPEQLGKAIPHAEKFAIPEKAIVGEAGYADLRSIFQRQLAFLTSTERTAVLALDEYLGFKAAHRPGTASVNENQE